VQRCQHDHRDAIGATIGSEFFEALFEQLRNELVVLPTEFQVAPYTGVKTDRQSRSPGSLARTRTISSCSAACTRAAARAAGATAVEAKERVAGQSGRASSTTSNCPSRGPRIKRRTVCSGSIRFAVAAPRRRSQPAPPLPTPGISHHPRSPKYSRVSIASAYSLVARPTTGVRYRCPLLCRACLHSRGFEARACASCEASGGRR